MHAGTATTPPPLLPGFLLRTGWHLLSVLGVLRGVRCMRHRPLAWLSTAGASQPRRRPRGRQSTGGGGGCSGVLGLSVRKCGLSLRLEIAA